MASEGPTREEFAALSAKVDQLQRANDFLLDAVIGAYGTAIALHRLFPGDESVADYTKFIGDSLDSMMSLKPIDR